MNLAVISAIALLISPLAAPSAEPADQPSAKVLHATRPITTFRTSQFGY